MVAAEAERLVRRVAFRIELASAGRRAYAASLVLAGAGALLFVCSRLLGLFPDLLTPPMVPALSLGGLAAGVLLRSRGSPVTAARSIDEHEDTSDLFLTIQTMPPGQTDFAPLVFRDAEERCKDVAAVDIVPFRPLPSLLRLVLASLVLLMAMRFVPQCDPFGKDDQRRRVDAQRDAVEQTKTATAQRRAVLAEKDVTAKHSEAVEAELQKLVGTFSEAKPTTKGLTSKRLSGHQQQMGKLWRGISEKQLRGAFDRAGMRQSFGGGDLARADEWRRQLSRGDTSGLKKELAELQKMAEQMAATPDPAARRKLARELAQRMKGLSGFMGSGTSSPGMQSAMKRALEQLGMAKDGKVGPEALKGLKDSLGLAGMELEAMAQSLRDLEALEQGLRAAQLAQQLNAMKGLASDGMGDLAGAADYAQLYEELLAKQRGEGKGMGEEGVGRGGRAEEDDETETDFESKRSKSKVTAGKVLLSWQTKEVPEAGEARVAYDSQVVKVRQEASEAILREHIPPGYHESIRRYFDSVGGGGSSAANQDK
ncbi:MAG: hypothetical protein HN976_00045 [Lentisphaerae bacterium]|jgi:hypothetical protein|nr:hypothetical protein [Lentisphaerota bacterium]